MTVEEAKKTAREMLSEERFYHTTCVAKSARALAVRYGEDPDRAEIAGYLHDIAKEMPKADLLQMIERSAIISKPSTPLQGLRPLAATQLAPGRVSSRRKEIVERSETVSKPSPPLQGLRPLAATQLAPGRISSQGEELAEGSDASSRSGPAEENSSQKSDTTAARDTLSLEEIRHCKPVWHAYAGGVYVRERLHCDDEIADAVSHHTTGRAGMTKLEKIVFLADYISEDRDFKNLEDIRKLAFVSLDEAIVEVIARQVKHLMKHKKYVDLNTVRAYNDLIAKKTDKD